MSRLIVLSNRVKISDNTPTAGGLAVALSNVLRGNSVVWMGWNGTVVDINKNDKNDSNEFNDSKADSAIHWDTQTCAKNISYMTTALDSKQYQQFYCGFANSVLWLLLHERPDLMAQTADDYKGYQEVNRLYAKQLKKIIEPDDVIWVHDYHFLSVAYHCRQLGINNRIGLFLHIPFAPLKFWQQLPQSSQLIKHLAHYDVFGTQTEQDKANFHNVLKYYLKDSLLDSLSKTLPDNSLNHTLGHNPDFTKYSRSATTNLAINLGANTPHLLTLKSYPISVDVAKIQQQVSDLHPISAKANGCSSNNNPIKPLAQQIIAVDRIDYSKGLLERFSTYQRFLEQNTEYQNKLKLLQIACPSRLDLAVYQRHYNEVRQAVNKVNQRFVIDACCHNRIDGCQKDAFNLANFELEYKMIESLDSNGFEYNSFDSSGNNGINDWQAISYSETVLNHNSLMKAFWHSDIGWVNSLKDGMNLVAKEYIAAQNPDNPGVLLLSNGAGAAQQMQSALIIDPHQPASILQALKTALVMPLAERKSRYQSLLQGLQDYDIHAWQQHFLDDLYDNTINQTDS